MNGEGSVLAAAFGGPAFVGETGEAVLPSPASVDAEPDGLGPHPAHAQVHFHSLDDLARPGWEQILDSGLAQFPASLRRRMMEQLLIESILSLSASGGTGMNPCLEGGNGFRGACHGNRWDRVRGVQLGCWLQAKD